jgi:hypothetical protein
MRRRDWIGLVIVVLTLPALLAYRQIYVEPREWGVACAVTAPPLACYPRDALLWLQQYYLWGTLSLLLGVWALVRAPLWVAVAAAAVGIAGVVNYNVTWGMLGAALGIWAWIRPAPAPARAART